MTDADDYIEAAYWQLKKRKGEVHNSDKYTPSYRIVQVLSKSDAIIYSYENRVMNTIDSAMVMLEAFEDDEPSTADLFWDLRIKLTLKEGNK